MGGKSKSERVELWVDRLNRFSESDRTVADFCGSEGCSVPAFYSWKRRLAPTFADPVQGCQSDPANRDRRTSAFARVAVVGTARQFAESQSTVIQLPGGISIRLGDRPEEITTVIERVLQHSAAQASSSVGTRGC